jgi:hypothetical protein
VCKFKVISPEDSVKTITLEVFTGMLIEVPETACIPKESLLTKELNDVTEKVFVELSVLSVPISLSSFDTVVSSE